MSQVSDLKGMQLLAVALRWLSAFKAKEQGTPYCLVISSDPGEDGYMNVAHLMPPSWRSQR